MAVEWISGAITVAAVAVGGAPGGSKNGNNGCRALCTGLDGEVVVGWDGFRWLSRGMGGSPYLT